MIDGSESAPFWLLDGGMRTIVNLRELKDILNERNISVQEFFTQGACWAYTFAMARKLRCACFRTVEGPSHAWIEQTSKCYDIQCDGVSRVELLTRFLNGPYGSEKASQEAKRLAMNACSIPLVELKGHYKTRRSSRADEIDIRWELAVELAEDVIAAYVRRGTYQSIEA